MHSDKTAKQKYAHFQLSKDKYVEADKYPALCEKISKQMQKDFTKANK